MVMHQQQQPSSRCPYTFWSSKCHQQVWLADNTEMHVMSARTTRTHDAGHASTGPRNTSLQCLQIISRQGCSNTLHIIFEELCCTLPLSYPNEPPGLSVLHIIVNESGYGLLYGRHRNVVIVINEPQYMMGKVTCSELLMVFLPLIW
jgi:hypothetical protein